MNKQNETNRVKKLQWALAIGAAIALAGCGGGGGGTVLADVGATMQGFWGGSMTPAPDGATRASTVVMPNGTAWVVYESATAPTAVANLALTGTAASTTDVSVTGSGSYYRLSDGAKSAVSASGTAGTSTFNGTATVTGSAASSFAWTRAAGFTTAALASDVVGRWLGTVGGRTVQITWNINAAGAVSGTSTTGCTYSGNVTPVAGTAVYNVAVSEDCQGTAQALAGIATLAAAKTSLRVVFTANAGAQGGLISFAKQ